MLPLIKPPIPKFPVEFYLTSPIENESITATTTTTTNSVDWPKENEEIIIESNNNNNNNKGKEIDTKWILKTDREEYIAALESKLLKLSKQVVSSQSSKGDSGYASTSLEQDMNSQSNMMGDDLWEGGEGAGEEEEESGGYGSAIENEDEIRGREGEGLLWNNVSSSRDERNTEGSDYESNESVAYDTPSISPSQLIVIPPTPTTSNSTSNTSALPHRTPSNQSESHPARRISFNSSVRISGGIKTSHSSRKRPTLALTQDLFSPTSKSNNNTTNTIHIRSRSPSPSNKTPLSLSASSSYRSPSTLQNHPSSANLVRSTSGPSSIQSRSSSPCSSIYAPLQPPSNTCPSPGFIRSLPNHNNSSNSNKKTLTFAEYLLGLSSTTTASTSNSSSTLPTTNSDEENYRGYRKILAEQSRRKLEERNLLKQNEEKLWWWERVGDMLSSAAGSRKGGSGVGAGVGKLAASSNNTTNDYGSTRIKSSRSSGQGTLQKQAVRRSSSMLSVSSAGELNSDSEDVNSHSHSRSVSNDNDSIVNSTVNNNSNARVEKTEVDFMFGTAPNRWFRFDWLIWKFNQLVLGIKLWFENLIDRLFNRFSSGEIEEGYQRV